MLTGLQAIVLAAGRSARFKTQKTKLIQKICGQEMVVYTTKLLESLTISTTVVVGYQKEQVTAAITHAHGARVLFVEQEEQRGTGHAIICTKSHWDQEHILVMNGDVPLLNAEIIENLYKKHKDSGAAISFVIAHNSEPLHSYGRVINANGKIEIVEAKDFLGDAHEHCCINAGVYIASRTFLEESINHIKVNEATQEFFITDLVKIASQQGKTISTIVAPFDRIRGVNTFQELWAVEQIMRAELIKYWMLNGIRFTAAQNVHIDLGVTIESGTVIGCGVHLIGATAIGKDCIIQSFSIIENSRIADGSSIESHSVVKNSIISSNVRVGPFAHVCDNVTIGANSTIGNFVEVKRSSVGEKTRAKHLAYIGDATIGSNVNIGAGTIVCNYDGTTKHQTIIEDNAYIGSNNSLVAPVSIGKNAFTAAGSVITENVPNQALAIARSRQINKPFYEPKRKKSGCSTCHTPQTFDAAENDGSPSFICAIKTDGEITSLD